MGLSRTVSEINGDFGPKSQHFRTRCIFCLWWIGYWCWGVRKRVWWGYRCRKKSDDSFSGWDRMHQRGGQTGIQTRVHSKELAYA